MVIVGSARPRRVRAPRSPCSSHTSPDAAGKHNPSTNGCPPRPATRRPRRRRYPRTVVVAPAAPDELVARRSPPRPERGPIASLSRQRSSHRRTERAPTRRTHVGCSRECSRARRWPSRSGLAPSRRRRRLQALEARARRVVTRRRLLPAGFAEQSGNGWRIAVPTTWKDARRRTRGLGRLRPAGGRRLPRERQRRDRPFPGDSYEYAQANEAALRNESRHARSRPSREDVVDGDPTLVIESRWSPTAAIHRVVPHDADALSSRGTGTS